MKLLDSHYPHKLFAAVLGIGLAAGFFAAPAQADEWDKLTVLTVNEPIQVQDKVLEPGKYVFKLLDSSSDRHVVQIFNGDQSHIVDTLLALPNYQLHPSGHTRFAFWETPPGSAKALRAWFYPGDNFGQEFTYPKHLAMLTPSAAPMPPQAAVTPEPPAAAPQEAAAPEPPAAEPPREVAQNTAPAPAPETAQAPAPEPAAPAKLPKTASEYPWVGLFGFSSLGLYGLLRLKRIA